MMKRAAVGLAAIGLLGGLAPAAQAAPVLEGSILFGGGPNGTDCAEPGCTAFFAAGCLEAMAHDHGITESIVDMSDVAGQTLTFTWGDTTTKLADQGLPSTVAGITFYVATSCTQPTISNAFTLTTRANERSYSYTLPMNAKWLVVVPVNGSTNATWEAA